MHLYNVVCAPITSQYAAIQALKFGRNDSKFMNEAYLKRRDYVFERLHRMGMMTEKPQGSFYIFPKIPDGFSNSHIFAARLLHEGGVAVVPGSAFTPYGEGYIRISYAYSMDILMEGLSRLERFIHHYNAKESIV